MDRSNELGPYGLYDEVKTKEIGLKAALQGTIAHLEVFITTPMIQKKREGLVLERNRLRSKMGQS
jgi:hypothetical protein